MDMIITNTPTPADALPASSPGRPASPAGSSDAHATDATPGSACHAPQTDSVPDTTQAPQMSQKRRRKDNTSAAAHRAYMDKAYDRVVTQIKSGEKAQLKAAAADAGLSVNALIIAAVNAYVGRELLTPLDKNPYI